MTRRRLIINVVGPLMSFVVLVVAWQLIIRWGHVQPYIAPTPRAAWDAITSNWSTLWPLTSWTIKETVYGFVAGAGLGIVFGVAMSSIPVVQRMLYPLLILTQAVPIVALASPLVLLLGFNLGPKVVIVAWIVFFPVTVNILDGLNHVDRDLLTLARVMGAKSWRTFFLVKVPAIVTPLFSGLKIGATYAVTGAIIGEMSASSGQSLALYQHNAIGQLNSAEVYGTTLLMTAIGIACFLAMVTLEFVSTPWTRRAVARRWRLGARTVQKSSS
jgi:ABC-type nitrate/sulfonate/bicarbonate transport system permease component